MSQMAWDDMLVRELHRGAASPTNDLQTRVAMKSAAIEILRLGERLARAESKIAAGASAVSEVSPTPIGRRVTADSWADAIRQRNEAKQISTEAKRKRAVQRHREVTIEQLMSAGDGRSRADATDEYENRHAAGYYADWVYGGIEARREVQAQHAKVRRRR